MLPNTNRAVSATALLTLLAGGVSSAAAQTYTWNVNSNATWDTSTANWLLSGSPAAFSSGTGSVAVFGNVITASRTIGIAAGGITAAEIDFNSAGTFLYTVGTTGNNLTLNGGANDAVISVGRGVVGATGFAVSGGHTITGSSINFFNNLNITNNGTFGTTDLTIAGAVNRNASGGGISVGGQGTTTISGAIGSNVSTGITKTGSGTLNLSSSSNAFTGGMNVSGGVLAISGTNDAIMGATSNGFNLTNGGVARFTGSLTLNSARVFSLGSGGGGIDLNSGVTLTAGGTGQFTGSGALNVTLSGGSTQGILSVEGANTGYTGAVTVGGATQLVGAVVSPRVFSTSNGASLRLQNAGSLANASSVTINNGSQLIITQPTTAVTGRLGTVPLTFNSGRFIYNPSANGGNPINDTFGDVNVSGQMTITGTAATGSAGGNTLNFGNLNRVDNAVLMFQGPATGTGSFGGTPSASSVRYLFANLTPDNATSGTTRSVVPWASNATSTSSADPQVLMTYDANGFRPLSITTEVVNLASANTLATAASGVNIRTTGSGLTQTIASGGQTINSFMSSGTQTIAGNATAGSPGDVLTIASGALANFNTITFNNATLNFPNGAYFHQGFPYLINGNSRITGSGGVTTSSLGASSSYGLRFTNTPTGGNTFTGGLFINGNAPVTFTLNNQLGNDGGGFAAGNISLGGGQLIFNPAAAGTVALSDSGNNRSISVNASNGTIGTAVANAVLQIPGTISGSGQVQFGGGVSNSTTGVVELTNTSANTYTGGTVVSSGILRISNSNQLGTGSVFLNGGTLQASSSLSFSGAPTMVASSTIDTQGNGITLSGGLNGSGGTTGGSAVSLALTKTGTGTLTIGGESTFAGTLTMGANAGAVTISGNGRASSLGTVTIGRNSSFNIDDSGTSLADRTGVATNIILTNNSVAGGAALNLTTNAAGSTFTLGALSLTGGAGGNVNTSTINFIDGGTGNNTATFLSLGAIAANNVLNIVGSTNLGMATAGGSRIYFTTPPSLTGGVIPNVTFTGFGGTNVPATYDSVLGVIAFLQTTGSFIDNINNVGPGSPTATNTNFLTNAATTANLGATINSLTIAGHTVTLMPGTYAPQAGNNNAPTNALVLGSGNLTSNTAVSSITSASPGTVQFGASGTTAANISTATDLTIGANVTLLTTGGLNKTGAGVLTINGTNSITGAYNIAAGTVNLPSSGTTAASLTGVSGTTLGLGGGSLTLNGSATASYAGVVSGSGSVNTAAGFTGVQTLSGANTFTGAVNINGGTLVVGSAAALGNAANAVTIASGGSLGFSGGVTVVNTNPVTVTGTGAAGRAGAIDNISGTNSFAGPITLSGNATIGATAGSLTLSGGISGSGVPTFNPLTGATVTLSTVALNIGANDLNKTGGGTLVLPNLANTMGNQNVAGGFLRASADNNLGATTNILNLSSGGALQYGAVFALNASRSIVLGAGGGGIDTQANNIAFSNAMTGAGSFSKFGSGALTINAAQLYTGSTNIVAGALILGGSDFLPTGSALVIGDPAASSTSSQLNLNGFNQSVASLAFYGRGSGSVNAVTGSGILTVNGTISVLDNTSAPGNAFPTTVASIIDLGGGVRNLNVAGQNNTNDLIFNAAIQNGGINYTGTPSTTSGNPPARVQFNAANTFSGGLTVNAGTVNVSSSGTLGAATNVLTINSSSGINSLVATSNAQTVGGLAGTVTGAGTATLSLGGNFTVNQAGNTSYGGLITGAFSVTKDGAGTLSLTNANTYSGGTSILAGTVLANNTTGSALGTGAVSVASGATLGGSGFVAIGSNTLNIASGGNLSPGNSPGILTLTGNLAMGAASNFIVELNGTTAGADYDRMVVNGTVNITDAALVASMGFTPNNDTFFILTNDGVDPIAGTFAGLPEGASFLISGMPATITYLADAGTNSLTGGNDVAITVIPTPGSVGLLAAFGVLAGKRRRR